MKLRLDQIGDEPYTWDLHEQVAAETLGQEDLLALSPISWRGSLSPVDPGYLLRAQAEYEQTLRCQRCLQPVTLPVELAVELLVLRHEPGHGEEEQELAEQDLGVLVVPGDELDLGPVLEEQLHLAVPMRTLCREDCKGLCPRCGADLNAGDCGCPRTTTDPRWASLAALRDRLPRSEG